MNNTMITMRTSAQLFCAATAVAFCMLLSVSTVCAQRAMVTAAFTMAEPAGAFHDNVKKLGLGAGFGGLYHFGVLPLAVGVEGSAMGISTERRDAPFSPTVPEVSLRVTTSHNLATAHAFLRLQPAEGFVRPYLDGIAGAHVLYTTTSVSDAGDASSTNHSDVVFAYGARAGVMVPVLERTPGESTCRCAWSAVMLDIGVGYMRGARGEYLRDGAITRDNGVATYDVTTSETDVVTGRIGVAMQF